MSKIDILIVNPPIRLTDKPRHVPHGLAILASMIRKRMGITPQFLDVNAHRYTDEEVSEKLRELDFDVVLTGGLIPVYSTIIRYSKIVKSVNPDAKIIAGGSAAMSVPELLLENSLVDIICTGEGEVTVIELLEALRMNRAADLRGIPGLCYRDPVDTAKILFTPARPLITDLDTQSALPAYDLIPMVIYLSNPIVGLGGDTDFISSRGCPFGCSFCYQPWGKKFRGHSVDFLIKAILDLRTQFGVDFITFQDDEFMADKNRVREFCEKRNRYLPDLLWSCTGRANIVAADEKIVKLMKSSGCVLISYGFESGSPRILDSMNKKISIAEMEKTIRISRENNLPIPASFIIGMPGEDEKSCDETLDFCLRNNLPLDSLMYATPFPGTRLFDFAMDTGRIDKDRLHEFVMKLGDARDFVINLTDAFTDEELIQRRTDMIREARKNYDEFISQDEIVRKLRDLFGSQIEKYKLDKKDLEHRAKHGGISTF